MNTSAEVLEVIDQNIALAYEQGDPFMLPLDKARPEFRVLALYDLTLVRFGEITNRAPKLVGDFALRALLCSQDNEDIYAWVVVEDGENMYAVPANPIVLDSASRAVGIQPGWVAAP